MPQVRSIIAGLVACLVALTLVPMDAGVAATAKKPAVAKPKSKPKSKPKPAPLPAQKCEKPKFRIFVDVGHTSESFGALSARNDTEFGFNLRLAKLIVGRLKSEGFGTTRLLVTEGKARSSLLKRVGVANNAKADFFLSVHHDSVPDKLLEEWEFEGAKSHFSDRFSGHSLFVSRQNPHFASSVLFARLLGKEMKERGLHYATQYTMPIMGRYRHPLLDKDVGVYSYDQLVVLSRTRSAAVLLEGGSIINRDEEMALNAPERHGLIAAAVADAMKEFCERRR
ncbi:N-acetylmuramoyl-L-alanine amidase [Bradyrhizobium guangdongense]|uniref:N-acetylmuramoyl-L-alanine amidase n=1 Tax=Bradyrhizobium guangdongense TaxID=1325090 RepID=UPI00112C2672|nr:N-acetylmuramoyl-L-alanine amidase [Bradyrhizobium guangdongense]TPQ27099.1 N-acetylmuramoyl-L-alanine amidase [Bradyrhizobium guangdongense]